MGTEVGDEIGAVECVFWREMAVIREREKGERAYCCAKVVFIGDCESVFCEDDEMVGCLPLDKR